MSLIAWLLLVFGTWPLVLQDARSRQVDTGLSLWWLLLALAWGRHWAAAGLGFGLFWLVRHLTKGKLGLADVWYAGAMGAVLGWWPLQAALGLAVLAALAAFGLGARRRLAFLPFLWGASVASGLWFLLQGG